MSTVKIGLCQMHVSYDKGENLAEAGRMIAQAAAEGADFAVLPEMFVCPFQNHLFRPAAEEPEGPAVAFLAEQARKHGIYLIGGSLPELEDGGVYNTSYFFGRDGKILGKHRKMHLFDAVLKDGTVCEESAAIRPGDKLTVVDTQYGPVGLAICFDVRFAELFRLMGLRGCKIIFLPAAFNLTTGPAHWDITVRMRALDQQCYVAACAPARDMESGYHSYAHSTIAGPSGEVLVRQGTGPGVTVTELDLDKIDQDRQILPILASRRTDLYETVYKGL